MSSGVSDFAWGFRYVASNPKLWRWVVAPFIVSAVVLVLGIWGGYSLLSDGAEAIAGWLPSWLSFLGSILKVLFFLLLLAAGYFAFFIVVAVVTAPFCEFLSEDIEVALTGQEPPGFSFATLVRDLLLGIGHAVRRLASYVALMAVLFIIGAVVPVIGPIIYIAGGIWLTVRAAAFDALDAVWARKSWSYKAKTDFLRAHRTRAYTLGGTVTLLLLVPVVNLLVLPIAAAGATRLYLDTQR